MAVIISSVSVLSVYAQSHSRAADKHLGVSFHQSVFLYSAKTAHLYQAIPYGFEIEYLHAARGEAEWEQLYNFPSWGIQASYYDYQNPVMDKMYGLASVIHLPVWRFPSGDLNLSGSLGFAHTPGQHDTELNPTNHAIGAPFSFMIQSGLAFNFQLTEQWQINSRLKVVHFSNGGLAQPNSGLNIIQGNLGLAYGWKSTSHKAENKPADSLTVRKGIGLYVTAAAGGKAVRPYGSSPMGVYSFSLALQKQLSKVNLLSLGIQTFTGPARSEWLAYEFSKTKIPISETDHRLAGVYLGHELLLGQLAVVTQWGYYIYEKSELLPDFYQLTGLKYYWKQQKFFTSLLVKTHGYGSSDCVEVGLGVKLF